MLVEMRLNVAMLSSWCLEAISLICNVGVVMDEHEEGEDPDKVVGY